VYFNIYNIWKSYIFSKNY